MRRWYGRDLLRSGACRAEFLRDKHVMRVLTLLMLSLLLALQYRLWVGDNGISELRGLQQDITRQEATNQQLIQRNQLLQADINDLRSAQEAVEERARNELGLIREHETFFRLIRVQDGMTVASGSDTTASR